MVSTRSALKATNGREQGADEVERQKMSRRDALRPHEKDSKAADQENLISPVAQSGDTLQRPTLPTTTVAAVQRFEPKEEDAPPMTDIATVQRCATPFESEEEDDDSGQDKLDIPRETNGDITSQWLVMFLLLYEEDLAEHPHRTRHLHPHGGNKQIPEHLCSSQSSRV